MPWCRSSHCATSRFAAAFDQMSDAQPAGGIFLGALEKFKDWLNGFKAGLSKRHAHLLMFFHRAEADRPGVEPNDRDFLRSLADSAETIWLSKILSGPDYKFWCKGQEQIAELQQLQLLEDAASGDDEADGEKDEAGAQPTPVSAVTAAAIVRVNKAVAMHVAGAQGALWDRLIKCISKVVINARLKRIQSSSTAKNKGSMALEELLRFYGDVSAEMSANIFVKSFGQISS